VHLHSARGANYGPSPWKFSFVRRRRLCPLAPSSTPPRLVTALLVTADPDPIEPHRKSYLPSFTDQVERGWSEACHPFHLPGCGEFRILHFFFFFLPGAASGACQQMRGEEIPFPVFSRISPILELVIFLLLTWLCLDEYRNSTFRPYNFVMHLR
jgi:hypothetical protein